MGKCRLVPLDDRVVIEPFEAEEKTPGGLLLPDVAKEKPRRGRVAAVGPGRKRDVGVDWWPMSLQLGDEVLYARYSGNDVDIDGKEYKIIAESEILAMVK